MKILLVTHGWPPELGGGVELSVADSARALARRGHRVCVVAGTLRVAADASEAAIERSTEPCPGGGAIDVVRIARGDLYFDHWHKGRSAAVGSAFRGLLRELSPDVVHLHHWLRLSTDLVAIAARERVPALITLHDSFASCPIVFRVRPDTRESCEATVGAHPCLACAGQVPPRTPWVKREEGFLRLGERQRELERELRTAVVRIAPSAAHAARVTRTLGLAEGALAFECLAPRARPDFETPPDRRPLDRSGPFVVSAWSELARHKGADIVVDAVLAARARLAGRRELRLEWHGREADRDWAHEIVERTKHARDAVKFTGAFEPEELPACVTETAQIFVHAPRAAESYGLCVDEAASLGLGLLLADAPAWVERLGASARYFPSGDARALEQALVELALDGARVRELQARAHSFASRLPDAQALAAAHEALYQRAIAVGAPSIAAEGWFESRLNRESIAIWDRAISRGDPPAGGVS